MKQGTKMRVRQHVVGWCLVAALLTAGTLSAADSPLVEAVKKGDTASVRALLKQRTNVNAREADGSTALHWAAHLDNLETADALIRAGATVNPANDAGATPLWLATENGSAAMVGRLLQAGADPNTALPSGETPLMTASRAGSIQAVQLLLRRGANPNAKENWREQTALMWAVAHQHTDVVRALIEGHADIHAKSKAWYELTNPSGDADGSGVMWVLQGGYTPLLFAARDGDLESARVLLAAGANANDLAASGASALVVALYSGNRALAMFLLDNGANANDAAAGYAAMHVAILLGDGEFVNTLLDHGSDPNVELEKPTAARRASGDLTLRPAMVGASPLWLAARFGQPQTMKALLAHGADPNFVKSLGSPWVIQAAETNGRPLPEPGRVTVLMAALSTENRRRGPQTDSSAESSLMDAVKLVVDAGVNVNAADEDGDTALHRAVRMRSNDVVRLLVEKGATLDAKNSMGETPLMAALGTGLSAAQLRAQAKSSGGVVNRGAAAAATGNNSTADLLIKLGAKE
jgi:ankyrin repeat protein